MADHLTEEEQIEALKRWWDENKVSVVAPIVLAVAGYVSWSFYQGNQAKSAQVASDQYEALMKAVEVQPGQELTAEQREEAKLLATDIADEHSGSLYADYSNMLLARLAVQENRLEDAVPLLQKVIANGENEAMVLAANSRLAKVFFSLGDYDKALDLAKREAGEAYKALYAELRGDIYAAQGKSSEASADYQVALNSLGAQQFSRRNILQLKIDNNKVADEEGGFGVLSTPIALPESAEAPAEQASTDQASSDVEVNE